MLYLKKRMRTLKDISLFMLTFWKTAIAAGYLLILLKYKLNFSYYFQSWRDFVDLQKLVEFLVNNSGALSLSILILSVFVLINKDGEKWIPQAEQCFSTNKIPTNWANVRARWIIPFVIVTNIIIFIAAAYFVDDVVVFCALFMMHHLNAVLWLVAFQANIRYYFTAPAYLPSSGPRKKLILERRDVMRRFMFETYNVYREGITAIAYGIALLTAILLQTQNAHFRPAPYLIVLTAELANQLISYRERKERDAALSQITEREIEISDADADRISKAAVERQ
ncbi:MAG: hypothetical protein HXX10_13770 [Rhodoplanes sp.]|uniref:hypothetical protein n=1 Tax=Rhodoplanes sp. TaxID=1968906 RepID=UPI0017966CC0|nr:hypothetical protein [Rhodoplanes sp.]NVO15098.1 hypothetical protein [Rhodoplanes sp.]